MAKMRSPNYPAIGLGEAIEALRAIWSKEQRTPVTPDVAAKHLGYKGLNGLVRMKLSALKKFGLLEAGNSGWRVSDLGLRVLHNKLDSEPYLKAVREAALRSELFRKLFTTHSQASDDALRSHLLLHESFTEAGAREFIKAFRNTLAVAKMDTGAGPVEETKEHDPGEVDEEDLRSTREFASIVLDSKEPATGKNTPPLAGSMWFKVPFGSTELMVRIEVKGDHLKREHVAKIRKYLALAEDDMAPETAKP